MLAAPSLGLAMADSLAAINLNHLLALDALLTEGNVTRAAKRVGISQSAMSHTLASLRRTFDDELLVRGRSGMQPTARALALAGPLRDALGGLRRVVDGDDGFDPALTTKELRIATADFVAATLGPAVVEALRREAPHATLTLRPLRMGELEAQLERGDIDLAIGPRVVAGASTITHTIAEHPFVCVVRADHPTVSRAPSLEEYMALDHLLVSPTGIGTAFVDEALAREGRHRHIACRVASFLVAPLVVARTDLVLTAPEGSARPFADALGLRLLPAPVEIPPLSLAMSYAARWQDDPCHRWFRRLVLRASAPEQAETPG